MLPGSPSFARLSEATSHHDQVTFDLAEPRDARHEAPALKPVTLEQPKAGLVRREDGNRNHLYPKCRRVTDGLAQQVRAEASALIIRVQIDGKIRCDLIARAAHS